MCNQQLCLLWLGASQLLLDAEWEPPRAPPELAEPPSATQSPLRPRELVWQALPSQPHP